MDNTDGIKRADRHDGQRKKIIVVDDVRFMLLRIRESLKGSYDIFSAQSAEKLFEFLETVTPDLILLDMHMPDVDGFEIIARLKADARYAEIPVIFLTGKNDRKSVVRGMSLGAVDVAFKPITDQKLVERIELQLNPDMRDKKKPIVLAVDDSLSVLNSIRYVLNVDYKA